MLTFRFIRVASSRGLHAASPLTVAFSKWLHSLPSSVHLPVQISHLLSLLPTTYMTYGHLLLLPPNTFTSSPWPTLISSALLSYLPSLWTTLTATFKSQGITHIALNAPIPSSTSKAVNQLRLPYNFTPLHPPSFVDPVQQSNPSTAFWCSAVQNGIFQTWSPTHTMFSRGNVAEKRRLLGLTSLMPKGLSGTSTDGISAVDLYAGIGYFSFCFAKKGVGKVLCWELNEWSVEGLQRGAAQNGWGVETFSSSPSSLLTPNTSTFLQTRFQNTPPPIPMPNSPIFLFHESNTHAASRIASLRPLIPPIRHVNCGLLPSSQNSWEIATEALDPNLGGWVHVHENVRRGEEAKRRNETVKRFADLLRRSRRDAWKVDCGDWVQVKSYGPGVWHSVLDIQLIPVHR